MSIRNHDAVEAAGTAQKPQPEKQTAIDMGTQDETDQLVFTLCAATGDILKVEKVSTTGERSEVPMDDALELAGKDNLEDIEAALDDAFEGGIIRMLESTDDSELLEGSGEEPQLRSVLLTLIIGSAVRRRLQRRLAGRLLLFSKGKSRE